MFASSIRAALASHGYVVLGEADLGLTRENRDDILEQFFRREGVLAPETPGVTPATRLRARDKVDYFRRDAYHVNMRPSESIALTTPLGLPGNHLHGVRREFNRVDALGNDACRTLLHSVLEGIPYRHRFSEGEFALNFFRTSGDVVEGFHRDGARYFFVYVLDKTGDGAETQLKHTQSGEIVFRTTLWPGQIVIVDDERYQHYVTPLIDAGTHRDAIVGMVYYPNPA